MAKRKKEATESLHKCIIDAILDKKGNGVVSLDLSKLPNAVCQNFIICHADSSNQVSAIAENIEEQVESELGEKVWQRGGYENSIWVVLDYVDVVVHVFQTEWREFYRLEELWADAKRTNYSTNENKN
ncbi:MAG: ribosome silencing factor [Bacteroidales bacterium]